MYRMSLPMIKVNKTLKCHNHRNYPEKCSIEKPQAIIEKTINEGKNGWRVTENDEVTFEGSTFWEFFTTDRTRSETSDFSRKEPFASSEKWRLIICDTPPAPALGFWSGGTVFTFTLRYFSSAFLAAISICLRKKLNRVKGGDSFSDESFCCNFSRWLNVHLLKVMVQHWGIKLFEIGGKRFMD